MTINDLFKIIEERKQAKPEESYVAKIMEEGTDRIVQKIGEEAVEVVIAAKNEDKSEVVGEFADLLFHSLVLLSHLDINPEDILKELERRHDSAKIKKGKYTT